ncbi:MAG: hypothetical protein J0I07_01360 [Myxococcales bacterium]|nr:hypothetical protein [Myxococcales bacterium]
MSEPTVQTIGDEAPQFYLTEDHHPESSTSLGFWLYLMSDCLIFATLFATYAVVGRNYAAGPSPADLFDLPLVAVNTAMLLFSSITYGFAMLQMERGAKAETLLRVRYYDGAVRRGLEREYGAVLAKAFREVGLPPLSLATTSRSESIARLAAFEAAVSRTAPSAETMRAIEISMAIRNLDSDVIPTRWCTH